jgi:methylated-DNA-protein-cysteine methyltransferase related protein
MISPFAKKVMETIKKIPVGKVATYKQIAELAGKPQGSRGVAWILHACSTQYNLPWHRVINSRGSISFDKKTWNFREQKKRLTQEGIALNREGELNLAAYQWKKRASKPKSVKGRPKMFTT